jgi:predicted deacetylase
MLIVSIHDVSPAQGSAVMAAWDLCARLGVVPALLVVPDWHGEWPIERHGGFAAWLRERVTDGAEVLLHGERHDEVGLPRHFADSLRAWGRTNREGEFLTLDFGSACERIGRGLRRLRAVDLDPIGFVPPAWLARDVTFAAASSWGLHVGEDVSAVRLLRRGLRITAPVVRWSTRTLLRALVSAQVAGLRGAVQGHATVVRVAIHPPDMACPRVTTSVVRTLQSLRQHHRFARYGDLVTADEASFSRRPGLPSIVDFRPGAHGPHGQTTPSFP